MFAEFLLVHNIWVSFSSFEAKVLKKKSNPNAVSHHYFHFLVVSCEY